MTALKFGLGAYLRQYAGSPEIQLLNRFVEPVPSNVRETIGLLARQGTTLRATIGSGQLRKTYSKLGLFDGDLFAVSGNALFRHSAAGLTTPITGVIGGGIPKFAWDSGPGYQHLFVADGELLQVYIGGTHASGELTGTAPGSSDVIQIGDAYFSWNAAVDTGPPDGTSAKPFLANPTSGGDPFTAMANLLNFIGIPGTDFSTVIGAANTQVTAIANGGPPATSLTATAISEFGDGNSIATTIFAGTDVAWGAATLLGGGTQSLEGVWVPTGEPINALTTLDHYVMASVAGSNKMFFILPGDIVIDTLNFFAKESNPDPIVDLCTVGDNFYAAGSGSIETWYATGDLNAPFAPIEGRTVASGRGIIDGTLVNVQDNAFFVGSDGVVYMYGGNGYQRISDNGIEERIRLLTRAQAGVP